MLTSDLKAHLLEVNSSPSMGIDMEIETSPGVFETVTSAVDEQVRSWGPGLIKFASFYSIKIVAVIQ